MRYLGFAAFGQRGDWEKNGSLNKKGKGKIAMKKLLAGILCASMVVLASQVSMAVDVDDVTPNWAYFREGGADEYIYASDFWDNRSCNGWGSCNNFDFDSADMSPNEDSTDGWKFAYTVVGTLPADYDSFYWDLDDASPSWKDAENHTKGTNWAQTSQYLDVDDWDYRIVSCGSKSVNRITWDYTAHWTGFIWIYTIKAVETTAWACVM